MKNKCKLMLTFYNAFWISKKNIYNKQMNIHYYYCRQINNI